MAQYVYTMRRVGKVVPPKRVILKNISLSFFPGAKIGVLGLNGSGKSTLLGIMAGEDRNFEGEAVPMPNLRIGHLPQEPALDPSKTVRESVEEGLGDVLAAKKRLDEVYAAYAEPDADFDKLAEEQAKLEAVIAASGAGEEHQLEIASDALRLPPWDAKVEKLSGGEKRRVALCRLLLSKPDMLLLDEPTNHLDAESVEWLEQFLQKFPGTVIAVTHDRYFLDNVAGWILELDRGFGIPWEGNYSSWLEQKEQRLETEAKQEAARIKTMKAELEWVRQNPKARQAKSKARLQRFEELSSYEHQQRNETQEIFIPVADRLGDKVIEFKDVSKGYGDRLLIDKLSFSVPPGAIVGIIGANGAGKSTLFRMITGQEKPDSGAIEVGPTVKLAYVDQSRDDLTAGKSVWEDVSGGQDILTVGKFQMPSRAYCRPLQLQGPGPAEDRRPALRRRARPAASREDADRRRQRAAPRRAVERPRRRDAARARGGAPRVRRHRARDLARPLVPRPHRHAHPRLRGRLAGGVLPGQLPRVRGGQGEAPRRGSGAAEADPVQAAEVGPAWRAPRTLRVAASSARSAPRRSRWPPRACARSRSRRRTTAGRSSRRRG